MVVRRLGLVVAALLSVAAAPTPKERAYFEGMDLPLSESLAQRHAAEWVLSQLPFPGTAHLTFQPLEKAVLGGKIRAAGMFMCGTVYFEGRDRVWYLWQWQVMFWTNDRDARVLHGTINGRPDKGWLADDCREIYRDGKRVVIEGPPAG